jgi:hypothetical protein
MFKTEIFGLTVEGADYEGSGEVYAWLECDAPHQVCMDACEEVRELDWDDGDEDYELEARLGGVMHILRGKGYEVNEVIIKGNFRIKGDKE